MFEVAFTLLSLGFLAFMAMESNRVLTERTPMRRRLVDGVHGPSRGGPGVGR